MASVDTQFKEGFSEVPLQNLGKYSFNVTSGKLDEFGRSEDRYLVPEDEIPPQLKERVFMASTIKVPYAAAFCKLNPNLTLDSKLPLSTIINEEDDVKDTVQTIFDYLVKNEETDPFYTRFIIPLVVSFPLIKDKLVNSETITLEDLMVAYTQTIGENFQISLKDMLEVTIGPSSNVSLYFLKAYIAQNLFQKDLKRASDALEVTLNDLLEAKQYQRGIRLTGSTQSGDEHNNNTGMQYEIEELFNTFFDNGFELSPEVLSTIRNSMQERAADPVKTNRMHEIKTIADRMFLEEGVPEIEEKSGYIGLNTTKPGEIGFNSGLEQANGWDRIPVQEGQSIVILNMSSVARVYLVDDAYIQISYSIAQPVIIEGDNEEEDPNYLQIKARINKGIQEQVESILLMYNDQILVNS